ncbi:hypothetical protein LINPERPRIM_LOCUS9012 [Linum perenne]
MITIHNQVFRFRLLDFSMDSLSGCFLGIPYHCYWTSARQLAEGCRISAPSPIERSDFSILR